MNVQCMRWSSDDIQYAVASRTLYVFSTCNMLRDLQGKRELCNQVSKQVQWSNVVREKKKVNCDEHHHTDTSARSFDEFELVLDF